MNGNSKFRQVYEPLLPSCIQFPGPYFYGNPFDAATPEALACKAETRRIKPWENVAAWGPELLSDLQAMAPKYEVVGDVRGVGQCALWNFLQIGLPKRPRLQPSQERFKRQPMRRHNYPRLGPTAIISIGLMIFAEDLGMIL